MQPYPRRHIVHADIKKGTAELSASAMESKDHWMITNVKVFMYLTSEKHIQAGIRGSTI